MPHFLRLTTIGKECLYTLVKQGQCLFRVHPFQPRLASVRRQIVTASAVMAADSQSDHLTRQANGSILRGCLLPKPAHTGSRMIEFFCGLLLNVVLHRRGGFSNIMQPTRQLSHFFQPEGAAKCGTVLRHISAMFFQSLCAGRSAIRRSDFVRNQMYIHFYLFTYVDKVDNF